MPVLPSIILALVLGAAVVGTPASQGVPPGFEAPVPADGEPGAAPQKPLDPTSELFVSKCTSCHTIGKGVRVGPDLKGAAERRDKAWLQRFIKAPSAMLDSDATARKLVTEHKGVRMPDLGLEDEQVTALIGLIERCSSEECDLAPRFTPVTKATVEDMDLGQALFLGHVPLSNGGPPCVSCHTVRGVGGAIGGGMLAKDLTTVFARLGDEGLDAALRNPPFPLMNRIFQEKSLAPEEVFALRSFLYRANRSQPGPDESMSVLLAGTLFTIVVLLGLNAAWSRRLRGVRTNIVTRRES